MLSEKLARHFHQLARELPKVPAGVSWLNPLLEIPECGRVFRAFLDKYYGDEQPRQLILGINPGRFGAGLTNVAFTDPAHLLRKCGIDSGFDKKEELSAKFIYMAIDEFGSVEQFYSRYFVNSVVPFGFVKAGKNYNYYDDKELLEAARPLAIRHIRGLLQMGMDNSRCICLGEGKNFKFLKKLNEEQGFFEEVVPLSHPRFIMQYRRKKLDDYLKAYLDVLR
jgi:hypothetical protein